MERHLISFDEVTPAAVRECARDFDMALTDEQARIYAEHISGTVSSLKILDDLPLPMDGEANVDRTVWTATDGEDPQ